MTFFDDLAGNQPERLAHRALLFALRHDRKLLRWLTAMVGVERRAAALLEPEDIQSEATDETRWRTDIKIAWRTRPASHSLIELKLGAPPTRLQREAGSKGAISVVVVPTGKEKGTQDWAGAGARVTTWAVVASKLSDRLDGGEEGDLAPALRTILHSADHARGFFLPELSRDDAARELARMYDRAAPDRQWRKVYRFLNSIDYCLDGCIDSHHRYLWTRLSLCKSQRYYGWNFLVTPSRRGPIPRARPWWIGFSGDPGTPTISLWHKNQHQRTWAFGARSLSASAIAEAIAATCVQRDAEAE